MSKAVTQKTFISTTLGMHGTSSAAFAEIAGAMPDRPPVPEELLQTEAEWDAFFASEEFSAPNENTQRKPREQQARPAQIQTEIPEIKNPKQATSIVKALLKEDRYDDVLNVLEQAIEKFLDDPYLHHFYGVQLTKQYSEESGINQDVEAEHHLSRAHELQPRDTRTLYELGRLYTRQGLTARDNVRHTPDTEEKEALAAYAMDRLVKAETSLMDAIIINSENYHAFWALGHVYAAAGKPALARGCYGHAKTIAPTDTPETPRILKTIDRSLCKIQHFTSQRYTPADIAPIARAIAKKENILNTSDKSLAIMNYVGHSKGLFAEGNIYGAIHALEQGLEAHPNNYSILFHLGLNYAELTTRGIENRDEDAEEFLERAHDILVDQMDKGFKDKDRPDPRAAYELGKLYTRTERFEDAEEAFFIALDINDEDPFTYYALGRLYLKNTKGKLRGKKAESSLARACFAKAHDIAALNPRYSNMRIIGDAERYLREAEYVSGMSVSDADFNDLKAAYTEDLDDDDGQNPGGTDLDNP